ncbi:hypothetical protein E2C01_095434 [Portunus trituberculatus]|uniref:Uncharacterized protein n=1 Tax=Portunus trituberculatus TaxID=210409 RepID=A0A5B7K3T9_PORTR|nr:hypothetical protein [Portunus trituberculatus]
MPTARGRAGRGEVEERRDKEGDEGGMEGATNSPFVTTTSRKIY